MEPNEGNNDDPKAFNRRNSSINHNHNRKSVLSTELKKKS